jgi:hypothetical membrane protein
MPPGIELIPVCSPLHDLMNTSFVLNALLTILGIVLIWKFLPQIKKVHTGLRLIVIGSIGLIGVGLVPEDVNFLVHAISAGALFILTNIGLIVLGKGLQYQEEWKNFGIYTTFSGAVGITALILSPVGIHPAVGIGLMERIVAYPLNIWLIVAGAYFLIHKRFLFNTAQ